LEFTQESEQVIQQISLAQSATRQKGYELQQQEVMKELMLQIAKIDAEVQSKERRLQAQMAEQDGLGKINDAELSRKKTSEELDIALEQKRIEQNLLEVKAEVDAVVAKAQAVSPDLVAALQAFADKALAERVAQSMSPLAILGGKSIADVFSNLLKGTVLGNVLQNTNLLSHDDEA